MLKKVFMKNLNKYITKKRIINYSVIAVFLLIVTILKLALKLEWLNGFVLAALLVVSVTFVINNEIKLKILKDIYFSITVNKRYDLNDIISESMASFNHVKKQINFLIKKGFITNLVLIKDSFLKEKK
jgi:hypothetical protein